MAYDQSAEYQPPQRAYLQQRQPNPGYSNVDYAGASEHGEPSYGQSYQQGAWDNDQGYGQAQDSANTSGGPRDAGHYEQQRHQEQDRNYDPRYQNRSQRGPPPSQSRPRQERPRGQPSPGRGPYHGGARGPPSQNGHGSRRPPQSRDPHGQRSGNGYGGQDRSVDQRPRDPNARRNDRQGPPTRAYDGHLQPNTRYNMPEGATTPVREDLTEWPMVAGQTPPKAEVSSQMEQERRDPGQRRPVPPRIDTTGGQGRDAQNERQLFSPAVVPPRPSTSHGQRPGQNQHPRPQYPQSATAQAAPNGFPRPRPREHVRHSSLGDIYDHYRFTPSGPVSRAPTSRDDEIEAEMPDFDSAAPGQTSHSYQRSQNEENTSRMGAPPIARTQTAPPGATQQYDNRPGADRGRGPSGRSLTGSSGHSSNSAPGSARERQNQPHSGRDYQQRRPELDIDRGSSAPPQAGSRGPPGSANGTRLTQQRSAPDQQGRSSNPDALPHHPLPVRPGLVQQNQPPPQRPPPVRNYGMSDTPQNGASHQRQASVDPFAQPVTLAELDRLRSTVDNGPDDPKQHLILVEKLAEASTVLASENGRADQRTTAKNRERYVDESYKRLKKLAASGYPDAQFFLADCYGQGTLGIEPDTKEAFKLYLAAAKSGHAQAAYRTAVCCEMGPEEGGGTSKDFVKAMQWYRRAATLGDGAAMYKVGVVLLRGLLGQPKSISEGMTWLKSGAERADRDNPHALHELAGLYDSVKNDQEIRSKVAPDDTYAKDLFMQAAQLGYKFSQFRLGQAYEYGTLGLPISNRDSIAWYTKAAAQGEHQAELALSGWYLTGAEGILEHSDTEAYLWARKAASSQTGPHAAKAMFAMGYFTENGIGCVASLDEAKKWYSRSASYKFPKAVERLEEFKKMGGGKGSRPVPVNGKLTRKDQKHNEENCVVM